MYILNFNEHQQLGLTREDILNVIEKSDLNIIDNHSWSPLMYILKYNDRQKLGLNSDDLTKLVNSVSIKDFSFSIDKKNFNRDELIQILDKYNELKTPEKSSLSLIDKMRNFLSKTTANGDKKILPIPSNLDKSFIFFCIDIQFKFNFSF